MILWKDREIRPQSLINEFPVAVGMFSVSYTAGDSFESAVRNIAERGPKNIARMFDRSIREADCRGNPDIRGNLLKCISGKSDELSEMRRAMNMVMAAFDSPDPVKGREMMDDAEEMALTSLRDAGQSYSSGLSTPCMLIFGLGIMVPMMLISFFPILGMGGIFQVDALDKDTITMITIVGIPLVVLMVILSIRDRNPFPMPEFRTEHIIYLTPMIISIPIFMIMRKTGNNIGDALVISLSVSAIISLVLMVPSLIAKRNKSDTEGKLADSLYELGNRLTMGENFDLALITSMRSMRISDRFISSVERELALCRGDVSYAIMTTMSPVSVEMAMHYLEVYRASRKDIRDSGGLALSIAHQLQGRESVKKDIGNRLRSMMDMMTGTSALFAPLILGMSVVMMAPISQMAGAQVAMDMSLILPVYLVELAVLISILSSNLMCKGDMLSIISRFCLTVPVSLLVFKVCSGLTI